VTSLHVKQFWNSKYYSELKHGGTNQTTVLPMILVTFTLDFVDTFIDSQTLIQVSDRSLPSLVQSLARSSIIVNSSTSTTGGEGYGTSGEANVDPSSVRSISLANRIQYIQHFVYNQTTQFLLSPTFNTQRNIDTAYETNTNETIVPSSSPTYSSFLNVSEYVPVLPFISPSDVQVYMDMLQQKDPTPTDIFSRVHTGTGNSGLLVQIFTPSLSTSAEPTSYPTNYNTSTSFPTSPPTLLRKTPRPTIIPRSSTIIPTRLKPFSFQPTRKPTSIGAIVLPNNNESVHSTFVAAVVVIVIAGFIIIAWMAWYLFYYKASNNRTQPMSHPSDRLGHDDRADDPSRAQHGEECVDIMASSSQPVPTTSGSSSGKQKHRISTHQYSRRRQKVSPSIEKSGERKVEIKIVKESDPLSSESKRMNLMKSRSATNVKDGSMTVPVKSSVDQRTVQCRDYWQNNNRRLKTVKLHLQAMNKNIKTHESRPSVSRTVSFSSQKSLPSSVVIPVLCTMDLNDSQAKASSTTIKDEEQGGIDSEVVHMIMSHNLR